MKKITTIFALTLSLMLTVAFTPSFAFAGDNSAAQNSGNKYTAVDEITGATENEDTIDDGEDIEEDSENGVIPVDVTLSCTPTEEDVYGSF